MRVKNETKAVINYKGTPYGPGRAFDVDAEHEKQMEGMLGDGRLSIDLGGEEAADKAEKKPAKK